MSTKQLFFFSAILLICSTCDGGGGGQNIGVDSGGKDTSIWPSEDTQAPDLQPASDTTEIATCMDSDGDGYGIDCPKGPDCNDAVKTCHVDCETDVDENGVPDCEETDCPGTEEIPYNGIDDDCDPFTSDTDVDKDGYDAFAMGGSDCQDDNPLVHPEAQEVCGDWLDNNCDGFPIPGSNQPECPQGQMCNLQTGQCEDDPDCNGCPMGQVCQSGECVVDETCYGECPEKQKCIPESGLCVVVGCLEEPCPDDGKNWACNPYTGYCYISSCEGGCPEGELCNPETGTCYVDANCAGGCLMNETCNQYTGTCEPSKNCPNDFCWGWPEGMWRVEGPDTLYYIDQYEWPNHQGQMPSANIQPLGKVQAMCFGAGKRPCTLEELSAACDGVVGPEGSELPYAETVQNGYDTEACNAKSGGVEESGAHPGCKNEAFAVWDLVGNLAEWTAEGGLFGGFYDDGMAATCSYMTSPDSVPCEARGFRCCVSPGDDLDGDGYTAAEECDESDAGIYPGAEEKCNEIDDNCNGLVDDVEDFDKDNYTICQGDCDDKSPERHPGAEDGVGGIFDQNCDGVEGVDADGDGQASEEAGGEDCDDSNKQVYSDCNEKECGEDGCGGVCGDCSSGTDCVEGQCGFHGVGAPCVMDSSCDEGLSCFDWPGGYCLQFCDEEDACPVGSQCLSLLQNGQACFRTCQSNEDCRPEYACVNDVCVCATDCSDIECGDDGCGGSCGQCPAGMVCSEGTCADDPNSCEGVCGDVAPGGGCHCDEWCYEYGDCCDDFCEFCPEFEICSAACDPPCEPGFFCKFGQCVEDAPCEPDCFDKECGPDGCGSICGYCGFNQYCGWEGVCVDF